LDFGPPGRSWRETAEKRDRESLIRDLLFGRYGDRVRIVAFNAAVGWSRGSRDVTVDTPTSCADAVFEQDEIAESIVQFIEANRR
jgi:hypothetical protein